MEEKLIIENLKEPISIDDIINHFKDCGSIGDVQISNFENSISAEVYFKDKQSLYNALKKDKTKLKDSIINLHIEENENENNTGGIISQSPSPSPPQHKYNTRSKSTKVNNPYIYFNKNINIHKTKNKKIILDDEDEEEEINESILSNKNSQYNEIENEIDNELDNENENEENSISEAQSFDDNENAIPQKNKKENRENKTELNKNEMNIDNIDNNNSKMINSEYDEEEEEENISDNEGYNNFMKEYKQYCKGIKKAINKHVEGELNVQDLLRQANNYYLNNDYPKAKEVLETIISVYPNLQEPYLILSQIYEEEKNDEKSLFFLMLAAQSSGGDKNIWIKCCNYNKKLKNYRQAEYCITRALKLDKKNLYILYERGALNEELGDIFKAIRIYTVLLKLYPNYDILMHIIILYERINNYEKAMNLLEEFFDKLPKENKINAVIYLYEFYLKYKEYKKGYIFYQKNIDIKLKEKDRDLFDNINNNSNFKLKKLFCFLYLSFNKEEKIDELNKDNLIKEIKDEFRFLINDENEATYGENCLSDNLNILFKMLEELDKIDVFENIYEEIEKELIKELKIIDRYKNIISQMKFQLGNYYYQKKLFNKSINLFEGSLEYFNSSSNDKIKNFILIKLSESYDKIGNKQKAINILNKTKEKNISNINNKIITKENKLEKEKEKEKDKDKMEEENNKANDSLISSFEEKENEDYDAFIKEQINEKLNEDENEEEINQKNEDKEKNNEKNNLIMKEEYNLIDEELNINKNKILNINDIFSNEKSENLFQSKIMDNFLSRKRHFSSSSMHKYSPTDLINFQNKKEYEFPFDNYLHRRIRNLNNKVGDGGRAPISNSSMYDLNLNDLKQDYEKLNTEIKKNDDLYLKLQESLLLLNNKEIDKFLEVSFEPLKVILSQEIEIENYLKDLFKYLLEKSNIKNYFHNKSNIFEKSPFDDNNLYINNTTSNNNIINLDENEENSNDEEINNKNNMEENEEIKDNNLFVRKTTSKIFLTKKKIQYTKNFIEKELNSLDVLSKYISKENFKEIISKFIKYSYEKNQNEQAFKIIILILNSYKIINKNDYFCYDAVIYSIMICYKKNLYKTSLELLKNSIIKYDLQKMPFFWVQLWNICTKISSSIARAYLYKLALNKSISDNPLLKLITALCYYKTNYFEFSIANLKELIKKYKNNSYLYFLTSLSYLHYAQNKRTKNKFEKFILMKKYFYVYKIKRNHECPIEVIYNEGRLFQYLGMYDEAWNKYQELYDTIDDVEYLNKETKTKIKSSTVYNMHLILLKGGDEKKAQEFLYNNLIL